jgi:hypothetical protein
MISAYAHLFHGDGRHSENPSNFLQSLEDSSANIPGISDSDKCQRFYLKCKADFDAEYWYEELESNSPMVLTSWPTFVNHFRVRWLGAPLSLLLEPEPVISKKPDTATPIATETPTTIVTNANTAITTTTAIPAPTSTAALTVYKTTTTPERPDRVADARHVIASPMPFPTQVELEATTTTSSMDLNNAITTAEQQDNEKRAAGREVGKGVEKWDGTSKREVERRETDAGEQERMEETQNEVQDPAPSPTARLAFDAMLHEPAQFDWAAEVDKALGLSPVAHSTPQSKPVDLDPAPVNLEPGDVAVDPVRTARKCAAPVDPNPVSPVPTDPAHANPATINSDPGDAAADITHPAFASATPISITSDTAPNANAAPNNPVPVPVEPDPESTAPVDPIPCDETVYPVLVDSVPADSVPIDPVPIDPACVALGNAMPIIPIPIPDEPNPEPTMLVNPIDPDSITHNSPIPDNPVPVDPDHFIRSNNTPISSVCVDPDRVAFVSPVPTDLVDVEPDPTAICIVSIESVPVTSTEHAANTHSNTFDDPFTVATVKTIYANPDSDLSTRVTGVALTFIAHNHISDTDYIFALVAFIIHPPLHLLRTTLICPAFEPVTRTCLITDIDFCFVKLCCFFSLILSELERG